MEDNWKLVSLYVFSSTTYRVSETLNMRFRLGTYPEDLPHCGFHEIYRSIDITGRDMCL
jgi:hypothetical protein